MEELKEKAKKWGIRIYGRMKKETIEARIQAVISATTIAATSATPKNPSVWQDEKKTNIKYRQIPSSSKWQRESKHGTWYTVPTNKVPLHLRRRQPLARQQPQRPPLPPSLPPPPPPPPKVVARERKEPVVRAIKEFKFMPEYKVNTLLGGGGPPPPPPPPALKIHPKKPKESGEYTLADFQVKHLIGQGGITGKGGQVYVARNKRTNEDVALKIIQKVKEKKFMRNDRVAYENEVKVLKHLRDYCPNHYTICYIANFEDKRHFYIVSTLLTGYIMKEIQKRKRMVTEEQSAQVQRNLVTAITFLFDVGISHGDLDNTNIMINPLTLEVKFIDFAMSVIESEGMYNEQLDPLKPPDLEDAQALRRLVMKNLHIWLLADKD